MSDAVHRARYRQFLARLRLARQRAGLTQQRVAASLTRPQSYVSKCELGRRRVDPVDLEGFAKLYRKPFSFFFPTTGKTRKKARDR